MPAPKSGESRDEFVNRCIPIVIQEGNAKDRDQAVAMCNTMYTTRKNMKLETVNIGEVEIFEAGKFNGVDVTEEDIDDMILNFGNKVTEPYITIDHDDKATDQFKDALKALSLGFVSYLKRVGKKLIADFKQVPKTLADLIEAGALKKKSIEFYKKFIHADGSEYENVLQGVTFHGANGSPAVTTLSDFLTLYKNEINTVDNDTKNKMTSIKFKEEKNMATENKFEVELVALKKDHEGLQGEVTTLKADNEALQNSVKEKDEELTKLKNVEAELNTLKEEAEKKAVDNLNSEADGYVTKQINLKKIIPASKDMYVKNYISCKKESDEALKVFKDDIEKRAELLEGGSVIDIDPKDAKATDVNKIDEIIELKMKNGKTFNEARKEVYKDFGMEV